MVLCLLVATLVFILPFLIFVNAPFPFKFLVEGRGVEATKDVEAEACLSSFSLSSISFCKIAAPLSLSSSREKIPCLLAQVFSSPESPEPPPSLLENFSEARHDLRFKLT